MSANTPADNWLEPLAAFETTNSFIVIIRSRPRGTSTQAVEWHGSVQHTQSRERTYFVEFARLNSFIAAHSETALLAPWRTRLSRRWQKTWLHGLLKRLRFARRVERVLHPNG